MGIFKGLNTSDIFLSDYISKKHWTINRGEFEESGITIQRAISGSGPFISGSAQYSEHLLYNSIEKEFYNRSLTNMVNDLNNISGSIEEQAEQLNNFTGSMSDLSLQTTITIQGSRNLGNEATVISIPENLYGNNIEEGSVNLVCENVTFFDKEGVILQNSGGGYTIVGDIIYTKGIIILYGNYLNLISRLSYTSALPIFSYNVNCRVLDQEFNYTYNRTISSSVNQFEDENFTPYVTSIGLYNNSYELLAVAKLSKPIKKSDCVDTTFKVQLDIS